MHTHTEWTCWLGKRERPSSFLSRAAAPAGCRHASALPADILSGPLVSESGSCNLLQMSLLLNRLVLWPRNLLLLCYSAQQAKQHWSAGTAGTDSGGDICWFCVSVCKVPPTYTPQACPFCWVTGASVPEPTLRGRPWRAGLSSPVPGHRATTPTAWGGIRGLPRHLRRVLSAGLLSWLRAEALSPDPAGHWTLPWPHRSSSQPRFDLRPRWLHPRAGTTCDVRAPRSLPPAGKREQRHARAALQPPGNVRTRRWRRQLRGVWV